MRRTATALDEARRWRALPAEDLLWESFGEDAVVYNRRSGETHFLNCTAAETLRILQDRAATLAEVVAEIGGRFGLEPQAGLAEQVGRAIEEFERAGLICWSAP